MGGEVCVVDTKVKNEKVSGEQKHNFILWLLQHEAEKVEGVGLYIHDWSNRMS